MGRTETSKGLAPPAVRKDIRAKQARHIINKTIPAILASNPRARKGVDSSELIANPGPRTYGSEQKSKGDAQDDDADAMYIKRKGQGRRKVKNEEADEHGIKGNPGRSRSKIEVLEKELKSVRLDSQPVVPERKIRILATDTLTAAHMLAFPSSSSMPNKHPKKQPNTCILNMASPLRPGGGVLTGATSQEEFLCARTTLLPSLLESYYRLPEFGGVYTPDVLVFRKHHSLSDGKGELPVAERWWVDVISAGMLRFPELEGEDDEVRSFGEKDKTVVEGKMRGVLRIMVSKGAKKVVLGAWGCGAYGCPVGDVAEAWRRVLDGTSSSSNARRVQGRGTTKVENFPEIEEVVFAIGNKNMAKAFAKAYSGVEVEDVGETDGEEEEEVDEVAEELRTKIREMEEQLGKVWNPDLKERMGVILEGLKEQLRERGGDQENRSDMGDYENHDDPDDDSESGSEA